MPSVFECLTGATLGLAVVAADLVLLADFTVAALDLVLELAMLLDLDFVFELGIFCMNCFCTDYDNGLRQRIVICET